MTGETPQAHGGGFPGEPCLELSVTGGGEQVGAIRLGDLRELLAQADAHGVDDSRAVIFERWSSANGVRRVRVTGAGVRVLVKESSLRPAEPVRASLGEAVVASRPEGATSVGEQVIIRPRAPFDARIAEHRVRLEPGHLHRTTAGLRACVIDPTILDGLDGLDELVDDPGDHGVGDEPEPSGVVNPADLGPAERFADLGGVIVPRLGTVEGQRAVDSQLRPRPVRDDPQA